MGMAIADHEGLTGISVRTIATDNKISNRLMLKKSYKFLIYLYILRIFLDLVHFVLSETLIYYQAN